MKKFEFRKIVFVLLIVALVLSACGRSKKEGMIKTGFNQAQEHWSSTVALEAGLTGQYRVIMTDVSTGYQAIKLKYPLVGECFTNSDTVIQNAVEGRYNSSAQTEGETASRPTGQIDTALMFNALVVNESYPDLSICQQMQADLGNEISRWNADKSDNFAVFWDMMREYDLHTQGELARSLTVDLLQVLANEAEKAGLTTVPSYIYPTFQLKVDTRSQTICDYYQMNWNPALNNCTLIGQAAYEYMNRLFISPDVAAAFDAGEDTLNPLDSGGN